MHYFGNLKFFNRNFSLMVHTALAAVTISCITSRVLPCRKTSLVTRPQLGRKSVANAKREAQAQTLNMLQT